MIECAILAIGEELLEGSIQDTNSSFLAGRLTSAGFLPRIIKILPDEMRRLTAAIRETMEEYPLILVTGGLGPTFDDLTVQAVADACALPLIYNDAVKQIIENKLCKLNVALTNEQLRQAYFPENSVIFHNPAGIACGFAVDTGKSVSISMPGVPMEMKAMFDENVLPWLKTKFSPLAPFRKNLRFYDLPESYLDAAVMDIGIPESINCIINALKGECVLRIRSDNPTIAEEFADTVKLRLMKNFLGQDDETPEILLINRLQELGLTLSVAESCTGGLLGGALTSVPGSSNVFAGGVISYDNRIKQDLLGVSPDILANYGAVSEECARFMAKGVAEQMKTDCAISTTGIAGPGGGTPEKPVGTVWISALCKHQQKTRVYHIGGDRQNVRERAVKNALIMLLSMLKEHI